MNIIDHPGQMLLFADLGIDHAKTTAHVGKRATISTGGVPTPAGKRRRANGIDHQRMDRLEANIKLLDWLHEGL